MEYGATRSTLRSRDCRYGTYRSRGASARPAGASAGVGAAAHDGDAELQGGRRLWRARTRAVDALARPRTVARPAGRPGCVRLPRRDAARATADPRDDPTDR